MVGWAQLDHSGNSPKWSAPERSTQEQEHVSPPEHSDPQCGYPDVQQARAAIPHYYRGKDQRWMYFFSLIFPFFGLAPGWQHYVAVWMGLDQLAQGCEQVSTAQACGQMAI